MALLKAFESAKREKVVTFLTIHPYFILCPPSKSFLPFLPSGALPDGVFDGLQDSNSISAFSIPINRRNILFKRIVYLGVTAG